MAKSDFDSFFKEIQASSPLHDLYSSIENDSLEDVRNVLTMLRHQDPGINISPALLQCVKSDRLDALQLLLYEGGRPNEAVVEAAACSGRPSFVAPLLDYGWPINQSLRGGFIPSILW